jgi:hypothetical protein
VSYDPAADPITLVALSKAIDKQLGKFAPEPGSHPIDRALTIKLFGTLQKDQPQWQQWKPDVPWPLLLTLLCQRAKFNRGDAKRLILDCTKAAIGFAGEAPDKPGFADRLRDAEDAIEEARESADKIPKSKAGATKWVGTCTIEKAD